MPPTAPAPTCKAVAAAATAAAAAAAATGSQKPWLFVGLGNPGRMYKGTRHNAASSSASESTLRPSPKRTRVVRRIASSAGTRATPSSGAPTPIGFEMIDAIAEAEGISVSSKQFKAVVGKGLIGDVPVMLAKPQTYMNASGESVGQLVSYFKIPLDQLVVIYDDLDLPFAKLRLLPKGGHGGHNGMRSIIDHFKQSRDFPRLRIGIGRPEEMGVISFVLGSFTKQEREEIDVALHRGLQAVRTIVKEGFNKGAILANTPQQSEMLNR